MAIHWYAHHLGDYAKDTHDLSMAEHGAYRLLIDYYYNNGGPIPNILPELYRVCKAYHHREKAAVRRVVAKFFTCKVPDSYLGKVDMLYLERCEKEIKKQKEMSDLAREKANRRWNGKDASAYAQAMQANNQHIYNNNHVNRFKKMNGSSSNGYLPSSKDQKRARVESYRRTGLWRDEWGEKPN